MYNYDVVENAVVIVFEVKS